MRFFTSDLHIYHLKAATEFRSHAFSSVEDMNKKIIDNINSVVGEDDKLYILGDVFFQPKKMMQQNIELFKSIKCKNLRCAIGNHDSIANLIAVGFSPEHIFESRIINVQGIDFVLGHLPYVNYMNPRDIEDRAWLSFPAMNVNPKTGKPFKRLSGHVHESWKLKQHNLNVGVDVWDFKPVGENELMKFYFETDEFLENIGSAPDPLDLYRGAVEKWGIKAQLLMFFEEVGELQSAISKFARGRVDSKDVAGEIADVENMLAQLKYMMADASNENFEAYSKMIQDVKVEKLSRLAKLLKKEGE